MYFLSPSKAVAPEQQWEGLSELQEVPILPVLPLSHATIGTTRDRGPKAPKLLPWTTHSPETHSKCNFRNVESHFNSLLWHTITLAISTVGKLLPSISLMFIIFALIVLLRGELGFSIILQGQQRSAQCKNKIKKKNHPRSLTWDSELNLKSLAWNIIITRVTSPSQTFTSPHTPFAKDLFLFSLKHQNK